MKTWMQWIGLPHGFGAHPADGKACDCLLMVWAILDEAGLPRPAFDRRWLSLARAGKWEELKAAWDACTRPLPGPEPYALTLFQNGAAGLGVGIVVDDGLLLVRHKQGVSWVPLASMEDFALRFGFEPFTYRAAIQ